MPPRYCVEGLHTTMYLLNRLPTKTAKHKLASRSAKCVLLGYSTNYKGYRCLNLSTNRIIVSRHVVFNEADFSFSASSPLTNELAIF